MLYEILVIFVAIPLGYWVAYLARDELVIGRKWFLLVMIVSAIMAVMSFVFRDTVIGFSSLFILLFTYISYWKSFDKKFTGKPID